MTKEIEEQANGIQPEKQYTCSAAGELLSLKADTIRKKVRQGLIRVRRYGARAVRIPASEIVRIQRSGW